MSVTIAPREYIVFVSDFAFGNDVGDVVRVEDSDANNVYYTDGLGRWCYLGRNDTGIVITEARNRRQALAKVRALGYAV